MVHNLKEKKILITGASGSVGSQLLFELNKRGIKAIAHVRESSDTTYIDSLGLEKRVADLRRRDQMGALMEDIDLVIHTAAYVNFRYDRFTQFTGINTIAAVDLFNAAQKAGVKRFLQISTIAAVGAIKRKEHSNDLEDMFSNEETEFNFEHLKIPYIMTKRAADIELKKAAKDASTELVTVNPSYIIAPSRTESNQERALKLFDRLIFPDIPIRVNMVDIRDVVKGIIGALEFGKNGERYILGGDNIKFTDFALSGSAALGKIPHMVRIPRKAFDLSSRCSFMFSKVFGRSNIRYYPDLVKMLDYDWAYSSKKAHDTFGYNWRSIHVTLENVCHNNMVNTYLKPEA